MGALTMMAVLATPLMIFISSLAFLGKVTVQAGPLGDDEIIEARLNRLNKPAVKSITLKDGDIVDCVDIYKQPAFDHPLLKNHKIQMWPSFTPPGMNKSADQQPLIQPLWQETEGCPDGTIPIRRVRKNDIIRATSSGGFGRRDISLGQVERAGMYLKDGGPYHGAKSGINVWEPFVEQNEWSHADIELSDGNNNQNFIEGGWLVHPQLYGDGKTRLYAYWTADGYHSTGCYNLLCPGFVQVAKTYVLGSELSPLSVVDGPQYIIRTTIYKDNLSEKWWLVVQDEPVGYWPPELFGNNFREAWTIKWGGGVLNTNIGGEHTTTQMGSGKHAKHWWKEAAFFSDVLVMDAANNFVPPRADLIGSFADSDRCYDALINFNTGAKNLVYYGGPGGHNKCR